MIKSKNGEKRTAKQLAREIVVAGVHELGPQDGDGTFDDMTEKEIELVRGQLQKFKDRLLKNLGAKDDAGE